MSDLMFNAPVPQQSSAVAEIAKSKAVQEVQASLIIAKNFPRDQNAAYQKVVAACKRPLFAEKAMYAYPRGGEIITGPSIRMAEMLAQNYGNLDSGVRELEQRDGASVVESYCWDMETNTRQSKTFEVRHERKSKKQVTQLYDPRDIYEHVANYAARRLRACILATIPVDFIEAAVAQVRETLKKDKDGNLLAGKPLIDRARMMTVAFKEHFGVTLELIEEKLGHDLNSITADEFVELHAIYNSLKDKQGKKSDFFVEKTTVAEMNKQADVAKETDEKKKAVEMFDKCYAELTGTGCAVKEILDALKVKSTNEVLLKPSADIYAAIEVLHELAAR